MPLHKQLREKVYSSSDDDVDLRESITKCEDTSEHRPADGEDFLVDSDGYIKERRIKCEDPSGYHCYLCRCHFNDPEEHVYLYSHQFRCAKDVYGDELQKYMDLQEPVKIEPKRFQSEKKGEQIKYDESTAALISEAILDFPLIQENEITYRIKNKAVYSCKACKCAINGIDQIYIHISESQHKENLVKMKLKRHPDRIQNTFPPKDEYHEMNFYCEKCDLLFDMGETALQCHCLMHLNKERPTLKNDICKFRDNPKRIYDDMVCLICDRFDVDYEHFEQPKHIQKLDYLMFMSSAKEKINPDMEKEFKDLADGDSDIFNPSSHIFIRKLCSCSTPVFFNLDASLKDPCQENSQCQNHHIRELGKEINFYKCFLCNKSITTRKALFLHYNKGKGHRRRVIYFSQIYKELRFIRRLDYTPITKLPKKIEKQKQDPKKKTERKVKEDVKFPYNKDLSEFGNKYSVCCLESGKSNIFRVDPEEIRLIKLGITLMYPFKGYKICIPCGCQIKSDDKSIYEHMKSEEHNHFLSILENYAKYFENCQDQFSDMELAKSCMMEESDEFIRCFACEIQVANSDKDIKGHMTNTTHINRIHNWTEKTKFVVKRFTNVFNDFWYHLDRYYCDLCRLPFKREIGFAKHLEHPEHLALVEQMKKNNKVNICLSCSCSWFGPPDYKKHFNSQTHIRFCKDNKICPPMMKKSAHRLAQQVEKCVDMLTKESNALQSNKDDQLIQSVLDTVLPLYPNAKAYEFGSRFSYLGFNTSDVDIFVDLENVYHELGSKEKSQDYIRTVKKYFLVKNKKIWKIDCILTQPRVPIMKLIHKPTGLKCDISFLNGLGVEKSKLIRSYVRAHPLVRSLMLFFKKWLVTNDLYGSQGINGYAVSWFTIFFLQAKGIVPSVSQLIKIRNQSNLVDGWECGFPKQVQIRLYDNYSVHELMQQLFKYYATFNYRTDVACPLMGKVMKKQSFIDADSLPEEMNIYKQRLKQQEMEIFRYDSPMGIQDPVDLCQNITKAVTKMQLRCFRDYCIQSLNDFSFHQGVRHYKV